LEKAAAPHPPPEPEYTPLDAAHDQISDLQDALARASVGELSAEEKEEASGLVARLREEVRVLKATLKAVTASRDYYQAENGELKQQIRRQRREIDKLAGTKTA
jgi:predicted RNase H-like nuclease (RuvC/YqgF family)